jgi:hypothetical protein
MITSHTLLDHIHCTLFPRQKFTPLRSTTYQLPSFTFTDHTSIANNPNSRCDPPQRSPSNFNDGSNSSVCYSKPRWHPLVESMNSAWKEDRTFPWRWIWDESMSNNYLWSVDDFHHSSRIYSTSPSSLQASQTLSQQRFAVLHCVQFFCAGTATCRISCGFGIFDQKNTQRK